MAIAIVEELWARTRAAIDDKIVAAMAAVESAMAAVESAEAAVKEAKETAANAAPVAAAAAAAEVEKLKAGAPAAFDTLLEIANELAKNETERSALANSIAAKADKVHTHATGEVDGLDAALDAALAGKADTGHRHTWDQVDGKPVTFPPTTGTTPDTAAAGDHTHTAADVGAAPADHSHSQYAESSRVTALEGSLPIIVSSLPSSPLPGRIYLVTG